jgi:hypothetical protein
VGVRQVLLWLLPQKVRFKFKLEAYVVLRSTESHAVLSLLGVFGSRYFQFTYTKQLVKSNDKVTKSFAYLH